MTARRASWSAVGAAALLAGVLGAGGALGQEAGRDAAGALVADLAACTDAAGPLRLTVAGLPGDQTALSAAEAAALRLRVEEMLQGTGRVVLAGARDVSRLRALREGTVGLSGAEAEALIAAAHDGDAAVFVVEPERREGRVAFRLQALSPDAACKITSAVVEAPLARAGAASVERVIEAALEELADRAPDALAICPVATEAGHGTCAGPLTDRLAAAAGRLAGSAGATLTGRRMRVTRLGPERCAAPEPDALVALGRLSQDADGDAWLGLEFRRGEEVVSAHPRTRVDLGGLGCDPALRPLLDHVAATARRDRARLDMAAASTPFAAGDRLDVAVELGAQAALYCWVLAPDETAFVALPAGSGPAVSEPGAHRYPSGFGLGDVVLGGRFENLFHCFAPSGPLPAALDERWRAAGPEAGGPTLLEAPEIAAMLEAMRALPGMVEATARIVVR